MVQFIDLKSQYNKLKNEINSNIQKVLDHGKFIMGPEVAELEKQLAQYVGVRHCITTSNGTDALLMPLMAWRIGKGDAVFVTDFTFIATAEVVELVGATPVFVDIDYNTYNMDPEKLEEAITRIEKEGKLIPKVVIPVDLFGLPADYPKILEVAKKHKIKVLEDAAQGFGGHINNQRAGSFGDVAATSFFPAKPLGCYGDGGAVFTNDDELAEIMKSIRVHGQGENKYDNIRTGLNARLDTIQAAILLPKLKAFIDYELDSRNKKASKYTELLRGTVKTPYVPKGFLSSWAQYSVLAESSEARTRIMNALKEAGIPSMIYYQKPMHLQTVYSGLGYKPGDFPMTENVCSRIFSLPMHPYLEDSIIEQISDIIKKTV